jgi:hypothetical protein
MNYIQEINSFNDWLIINPSVSSDDIALWYALMNLNNISGWQKEFTVAISTIVDRSRLSRSAIYRSRNRLVQLGRIRTKERSGNQCSIYEVIPFVSHSGTQPGTQYGTHNGTQAGTIIQTKLNETKEEVIKGDKPHPVKREIFKPPTFEEAEAYVLTLVKNNQAQVTKTFFDHYESNGWKVGKNKMVDWKAAIRKSLDWEKNKNLINGTHQQSLNGSGEKLGTSEGRLKAARNF